MIYDLIGYEKINPNKANSQPMAENLNSKL